MGEHPDSCFGVFIGKNTGTTKTVQMKKYIKNYAGEEI
jgi:hypothetical protein